MNPPLLQHDFLKNLGEEKEGLYLDGYPKVPGKGNTASFMCISSLGFTPVIKTALSCRGYYCFCYAKEEEGAQRG